MKQYIETVRVCKERRGGGGGEARDVKKRHRRRRRRWKRRSRGSRRNILRETAKVGVKGGGEGGVK